MHVSNKEIDTPRARLTWDFQPFLAVTHASHVDHMSHASGWAQRVSGSHHGAPSMGLCAVSPEDRQSVNHRLGDARGGHAPAALLAAVCDATRRVVNPLCRARVARRVGDVSGRAHTAQSVDSVGVVVHLEAGGALAERGLLRLAVLAYLVTSLSGVVALLNERFDHSQQKRHHRPSGRQRQDGIRLLRPLQCPTVQ